LPKGLVAFVARQEEGEKMDRLSLFCLSIAFLLVGLVVVRMKLNAEGLAYILTVACLYAAGFFNGMNWTR
jgi:hypothetical protein